MRLTPFDEFPFHQHPTPFNVVATTDSHFNDGYWFAFYGPEYYIFSSMRLHPNVNAIDGAASIAYDNRQRAVRASRELRAQYEDLQVGPLRLDILEPMHKVRLRLGPNPTNLEFDVIMTTHGKPFLEDRYTHMKYGAVVNDTLRYTQVTRAEGTVTLDGKPLPVEDWYGIRDHSWGVRSSMGHPIRIGGSDRTAAEADRRAIRFWVPFQVGDHCGMVNTHEDVDGNVVDFEGRLDFEDGHSVELVSMTHRMEYLPGTKRPIRGVIELLDEEGVTRTYELEASGTPADVHALGYYRGWHDGLSAGIYRGTSHLEHDDYDTTPGDEPTGPPHVKTQHRMGPTEFPMFIKHNGESGMAHFEHYIYGSYKPYGFGS